MQEANTGWKVVRMALGPLLRSALRIQVQGGANLPRTGGALLAPNHVSVLDAMVLGLIADDRGRQLRILAGAEFFESKLGPGLRMIRAIPIRRGARDVEALDAVKAELRDGAFVCVFPEGRVGDAVEIRRGRSGLARLALATGVPVIPAGIWGTHQRWPRDGLRMKPPLRPNVAVVLGQPMKLEGDDSSPRDVRAATNQVMTEIARLVDHAKRRADR